MKNSILTLIISLLALPVSAEMVTPKNAKELQPVTVMITNKEKTSGGSGVIYRSSERGSFILTNSHICEILEEGGGLVITTKGEYTAERYKRSKKHDVCLIEVVADLKLQTRLAEKAPEFGDNIRVSGHPYLIPTTVTEGHLSKLIEIQLLVGTEKCTDKEAENDPFLCIWFGGMPIIKNFSAQTTSAFIAPGNSGSAVFNENGEIVGLAFAGIGRGLSHGFIVPLEYLKLFVQVEAGKMEWSEANGPIKFGSEGGSPNKRNTTVGTRLKVTKANLDKLTFPAIKDTKIEKLVEKVDLCRKGLEKCSF